MLSMWNLLPMHDDYRLGGEGEERIVFFCVVNVT